MSMSVSALLRASPSIGGIGRGMLVPDTKAHSAAREAPCTSPTDLRSCRTGLFLFRNSIASTRSLPSLALLLSVKIPVTEKDHSDSADDAGIARIHLASFPTSGKALSCCFHQSKGSESIPQPSVSRYNCSCSLGEWCPQNADLASPLLPCCPANRLNKDVCFFYL